MNCRLVPSIVVVIGLVGSVLAVGPAAATDPIRIAIVPDTQFYARDFPDTFFLQTEYVAQAAPDLVLHVGDIVHNAGADDQWMVADQAWQAIDDAEVPYLLAAGNHDTVGRLVVSDEYVEYFGPHRYEQHADTWYLGVSDSTATNHYQLHSINGVDFVVLALGFQEPMSSASIAWADSVLNQFPNHLGVLVSHWILDGDGSFGNDGQRIYDGLKGNPNLRMMFAGHLSRERYREDSFGGSTVHTMMMDYQNRGDLGGSGFLRQLELDPSTGIVNATTYSPLLQVSETDEDSQFSFTIDMNPNPGGGPVEPPPPPPPESLALAVSSTNGGSIPFRFSDEDLLLSTGDEWSLLLDGSEVLPTRADIDALHLATDGMYFSLAGALTVDGVRVDDSDVLFLDESGELSVWFSGAEFGLTSSGEDIDAISFSPAGDLIFSTHGSGRVDSMRWKREDLIKFDGDEFSLYLDGSDVALTRSSENVVGLAFEDDAILIKAKSSYAVEGASGNRDHVLRFEPDTLGEDSSGSFNPLPVWDAADHSFERETINALSLVPTLP